MMSRFFLAVLGVRLRVVSQVCAFMISAVLLSGVAVAQTPPSGQTPLPPDAVSPPALQILGYGDINLLLEDKGSNADANSFRLGQLDLLFLSNLSDAWRVLVESVVRVEGNEFATDLERMTVTYAPRDYFELAMGRYNATFGYYSSTYSHNSYFQTAATRPILFEFEDDGGILPEHNTGLAISGRLPGPLRVRYIVEVANGQPLRRLTSTATEQSTPIAPTEIASAEQTAHGSGTTNVGQTIGDENRLKAVNVGLQVRPARVPGLQFGANAYFDTLGADVPRVNERIYGAFVAFLNEHWEVLLEGVSINTRLQGGPWFRSGGFYGQLARQIAGARPFARYQMVTVPDGEPALGKEAFRTSGPSLGLRLDPAPFVSMKFQVDRFRHEDRAAETSFIAQVSFAF